MEFTTRFILAPSIIYGCTTLGLVILKPSHKDWLKNRNRDGADPVLSNAASPLTTVLRVMVSQPRLCRLLAFIQRHPLPLGQLPQPGKVPRSAAHLGKLLFESFPLQTA